MTLRTKTVGVARLSTNFDLCTNFGGTQTLPLVVRFPVSILGCPMVGLPDRNYMASMSRKAEGRRIRTSSRGSIRSK